MQTLPFLTVPARERMTMRIAPALTSLFVALLMSISSGSVRGAELPGAEREIADVIDELIERKLAEKEIKPAPSIEDVPFLRRLSLDLAGRVPTPQELADFEQLPPETRRLSLIDNLLNSSDFAFHQRNEIDLLLLARIRKDDEWRKYLLTATRENRSWSQIFQEVITPEYSLPDQKGSTAFIRERVRELDDLTNDTAVLFFGVNIGCAKCHDHPLVDDWHQKHYFGMSSFFKRTYITKGQGIAEDFQGEVKFTTVGGEEKQASFVFLTNAEVKEPETMLDDSKRRELQEQVKNSRNDDKVKPPTLSFSPRKQLVELALGDQTNSFLARNIVNRIWARLMGYGLVMPLDQMHSGNRPSHPELMDWLARDLIAHHYDLKRLIRGIVQSRAYARSSRWTGGGDIPSADLFAVGRVCPLTPRQLSLSLTMVSQAASRLPGLTKPADWETQRQQFEDRSNGFADLLQIPEENFQVSTDEALLFSNSKRFESEYLGGGNDRLVGQLRQMESDEEATATLFRAVLSRNPDAEESQSVVDFLSSRHDRREESLRYVSWALMSSPEFRFNH
ncbi:MAG: DUF1553 domain-containing protein [Planctomycetaceae bacterium]